jgi:hypothetical protein
MRAILADGDLSLVVDANRFDNPHQAIGDGPVDFRQVPQAEFPISLRFNRRRRAGGEALRLALALLQDLVGQLGRRFVDLLVMKAQSRPKFSTSLTKGAWR